MYKEIKSDYIKKKIKQTKYSKRQYIHDLIRIELLAQGKTFGMSTGYAYMNLPNLYPEEWKAIWQELNPKGYKANIRRKKKEAEEEKKEQAGYKREEKARKKKERDEWKEIGGLD